MIYEDLFKKYREFLEKLGSLLIEIDRDEYLTSSDPMLIIRGEALKDHGKIKYGRKAILRLWYIPGGWDKLSLLINLVKKRIDHPLSTIEANDEIEFVFEDIKWDIVSDLVDVAGKLHKLVDMFLVHKTVADIWLILGEDQTVVAELAYKFCTFVDEGGDFEDRAEYMLRILHALEKPLGITDEEIGEDFNIFYEDMGYCFSKLDCLVVNKTLYTFHYEEEQASTK